MYPILYFFILPWISKPKRNFHYHSTASGKGKLFPTTFFFLCLFEILSLSLKFLRILCEFLINAEILFLLSYFPLTNP